MSSEQPCVYATVFLRFLSFWPPSSPPFLRFFESLASAMAVTGLGASSDSLRPFTRRTMLARVAPVPAAPATRVEASEARKAAR